MSEIQEQIKDSQDSEVRFMYLTEEGNEVGWRNWESGEAFIQEFNLVLKQVQKKDPNAYDRLTEQILIECKENFFKYKTDAIYEFFGPETVIVTESEDKPVGIRLGDVFFLYFGVMKNLLHMACWLSYPYVQEDYDKRGMNHDENELLCCFLFKSRSQKLSEYTQNIGDAGKFLVILPRQRRNTR